MEINMAGLIILITFIIGGGLYVIITEKIKEDVRKYELAYLRKEIREVKFEVEKIDRKLKIDELTIDDERKLIEDKQSLIHEWIRLDDKLMEIDFRSI